MEIPQVSKLPVLDQGSFPAIPLIPPGKPRRPLLCFGTQWRLEKESAAVCLVYACIDAGKWRPVAGDQFVNEIRDNALFPAFMRKSMWNAAWDLVAEGFIEAVSYQDMPHFIPTPELATMVCDRENLQLA